MRAVIAAGALVLSWTGAAGDAVPTLAVGAVTWLVLTARWDLGRGGDGGASASRGACL